MTALEGEQAVIRRSNVTYAALVGLLALLAALNVVLPQGGVVPLQDLPASEPILALVNAAIMLVVYGGLGFLGLGLCRKVGFADLWTPGVSNRQRFLVPALSGLGLGIFFILTDALLGGVHGLGPLPHPPFPTSLVASAVAGIGEEILFRLFFVSFWLWVVSHLILRDRTGNAAFWTVALLSALAFAAAHVPSVMLLFDFDTVGEMPQVMILELILLNGVLSLFAAGFLRKYGFLAAVGVHFWTDVVWHVVWGAV